jgi:hypothetical protein
VAAPRIRPPADADDLDRLRHAAQRAGHLGAALGGQVDQRDVEFAGTAMLRHAKAVVVVARMPDDDLQHSLEPVPQSEDRDPVARPRIERRRVLLGR